MEALGEQEQVQYLKQDAEIEFPPTQPREKIFVQDIVQQGKIGGQPEAIQQGRDNSLMLEQLPDGTHADNGEADPRIELKTFYIEKGLHRSLCALNIGKTFCLFQAGSVVDQKRDLVYDAGPSVDATCGS